MNDKEEFFDQPIYAYSDRQAIEDGLLVDISSLKVSFRGKQINRMTRHLWDKLEGSYAELTDLADILKTKCSMAGLKGGIWQVPPGLWLIENEVNGWTIMFPEDY